MFNFKNKSIKPHKKCNPLQSLYEVEYFLRRLSYAKNSISFANKAKYLINKGKKH